MDLQSGAVSLNFPIIPDATHPYLFAHSISEGDRVLIPIYAMNTDRDVWGDDSLEFR